MGEREIRLEFGPESFSHEFSVLRKLPPTNNLSSTPAIFDKHRGLYGVREKVIVDLKEILKKIQLFSQLTNSELNQIINSGQVRSVDEGIEIFREGSLADSLYAIINGGVKIYRRDDDGEEIKLNTKAEGGFFGELALIDGELRSASVSTLETSEFFVLERESFLKLLTGSPQILSHILKSLTQDVRNTSEKVFQEELAKQNLQREMELQRHRALSLMVAGVAHEINTPLGIIKTASCLIKKNLGHISADSLAIDAEKKEVLDDIIEAARLIEGNINRAHNLVESFKKTSVSQITGKKENVDLVETINDIVGLFKINARQAGLTIEIKDHLSEENRRWLGYPGYLSQIILNLLSNIKRYAYPSGSGGKVDIVVDVGKQRGIPVFKIGLHDFGCGIPPENLDKVFDAFFTTGRTRGGTGLGMAIVHNLVTSALKGRVTINSNPGEGTQIQLVFPCKINDNEQA